MGWSKIKIAVVTMVAVLVANGVTILVLVTIHRQRTTSQEAAVIPSAGGEVREQPIQAFAENEMVMTTFSEPAPDGDGFIPVFNGQDLTGWHYNPNVWSVSNGIISGRLPTNLSGGAYWLTWAGGQLEDFELRLKVRATGGVNSGVAVRARWSQQRYMPGYQAEIQRQDGGLFVIAGTGRERKVSQRGWRTVAREEAGQNVLDTIEPLPDAPGIADARAALRNGEWCDFGVVAQGAQFIVQINGVTIVDTRDEHPTKFLRRGMLGLEYNHRTGTEDAIEFKDIRLKRLGSTAR